MKECHVRQCGKIIGPNRIHWEDGEEEDCEIPHDFPPKYLDGRGFLAVVVRDENWKFVDIVCIEGCDWELPAMTDEEFREFLSKIPTTASLPDADWD